MVSVSHTRPLAVAILLLGAVALRADYRSDFRNGIRAYSKKDWPATIDSMRKAIAQNSTESTERIIISGTWYVAYTPHFYLGVALAESKRCDEARPELAKSEAQGIIQKFEAVALKKTRDACGPAPQLTPPLTASAAPATTTTTQSAETHAPATAPPPVTATIAAVSTQPAPQTTSSASAAASRPQPPVNLAEAVRAYARGEYQRAITLLAASTTNERVYKAQVALFRGASRYSQFLAAGGTNTSLKRQIIADVLEYRGLDKRPVDPRLFSPRFRDFVANPH